MYCPRCSKEFASGTSYCRTCGLSLGAVVEIVTGDAENEPEIKKGPNEKLTRPGIGIFIIGAVVGLCIPIFKNLEFFTAAAITRYIFLLLVMLAILLIGAGALFPQKRYIRKKGNKALSEEGDNDSIATGRLGQLPSAERNIGDLMLPKNSRQPDSVTEHTTRRLG